MEQGNRECYVLKAIQMHRDATKKDHTDIQGQDGEEEDDPLLNQQVLFWSHM